MIDVFISLVVMLYTSKYCQQLHILQVYDIVEDFEKLTRFPGEIVFILVYQQS
jgi:hypothetical protein